MPTSSKRKLKKYPKQVIKERVIKVIGKLPEESKFIISLREKKTSPKTLELQDAKTAKFTIELVHDCIAEGTYSNPERQKMKREQLHEKKPKRKARWERSLVVSTPSKSKRRTKGGVNVKRRNGNQ
jgi:hypothetical protein